MPGMNGWAVGAAIRVLCKEQGIIRPPFILLTGWDESENEQEKMVESGVDRVVGKPVDILKLMQIAQELWDARLNRPPEQNMVF